MSYTGKTEHYELPQYVGTDLAEWNDNSEAFAKIDTALYDNKDDLDRTRGRIELLENWKGETGTRLSQMSGDLAIAKATAVNADEKVDNLEIEVSGIATNIGDLSTLLTPDKTSIVNAINSLMGLINERIGG